MVYYFLLPNVTLNKELLEQTLSASSFWDNSFEGKGASWIRVVFL